MISAGGGASRTETRYWGFSCLKFSEQSRNKHAVRALRSKRVIVFLTLINVIIAFWCVASASGTVSCDLWHDYRDCIERSDSNNCVGLLVELINLSDASRDDSRWHFVRCHGCDLQKAPIFEVCDEDLVLIAIRKRVHDAVSLTIFSPNEWTKSCNRLVVTRYFILSPI